VADEGGRVRIEVGFDGGQIMGALVTPQSAEELERALGSGGDGVLGLDADDGHYSLALRRIVYIKRFSRESRVGFGAG
jgi:hypothetical protein